MVKMIDPLAPRALTTGPDGLPALFLDRDGVINIDRGHAIAMSLFGQHYAHEFGYVGSQLLLPKFNPTHTTP